MVFSGAANKIFGHTFWIKPILKHSSPLRTKVLFFLMFMINLILGLLFSRTVVKLMN